jgi:hypothetical protein
MQWIDRFILLFVGAGLWALAVSYVLDSRYVTAQSLSLDDIVHEAVQAVGATCTVHGGVIVYDGHYGEIDGGYLNC